MSKEIFSKRRNSNKNNFLKIFLGVLAIIILLLGGIKVVTIIGCHLANKASINKEQKEQVAQVESRLATIARQGRAFGIHLILATQRPDANILAGQIKNNIDCRVCGRADNILSQIILDSTDAADRIPKTSRGRFFLHDGTVFQAFLFDDKTL